MTHPDPDKVREALDKFDCYVFAHEHDRQWVSELAAVARAWLSAQETPAGFKVVSTQCTCGRVTNVSGPDNAQDSGMVLVPMEPSIEMCEAFTLNSEEYGGDFESAYRAMIACAASDREER